MENNRKPRCIICNVEKEGIDIMPDSGSQHAQVAQPRPFKYKNPHGRRVRECYLKYRKARKSFEHKRVAYLVIGVLFAIVLMLASAPTRIRCSPALAS